MSSTRPLTNEQQEQVASMLRTTDRSFQAIADCVQCTKGQVQRMAIGIERANPKKRSPQMASEQQRIVAQLLVNTDFSYAAIAQRADCSRRQVKTFALRSGAPARTPGRKPKDTGTELVTDNPPAPEKKKRQLAPRLTTEKKTHLRQLLDAGSAMTLVDIATAVGCTRDQVSTFKKALQNA